MSTRDIKQKLLQECQNYVSQRLQRIQNSIEDIQESLTSETKSTAGDKHETGRAMLQLEREKAGKQLAEVQKLQEILQKIDINATSNRIHLGSLIETSNGNYFISISVGKIQLNDYTYFAIAPNSPIGKALLGKTLEDTFSFNGSHFNITGVQ
ncbi:3-oxoacyl-ACP synthase [Aquimarina gracilis]|uniref:3-oxoacyl-ACP synthase n=1 Tax=Aquimarina gracilis TaxID=874422 RepID=A0ABU5ZZS9_9FLAO|nr:3-oxoacyl-ACP synthase [Aquimarina gracilis]MEB3347393.1 3-oxoacyl-ACP synthase [Aquimarina gracilis]